MQKTPVRLLIVAVLVGLVSSGAYWVQTSLKHIEVAKPDWKIADLPMQLGPWQGEKVELDADLFNAIGADAVAERRYTDDANHVVSLHAAVFSDPDEGVKHSPFNCYRSQGWSLLTDKQLPLEVKERPEMKASYTTWERGSERAQVVYWYELGDDLLFDRSDLSLKFRWKMRGKVWPVLVKVLISTTPTADPLQDETRLRVFSESVAKWLIEQKGRPVAAAAAE